MSVRMRAAGLILVAGLFFAHAADRDRYVTGLALGAGSGRATGGLADHSLPVMLPGGIMVGTSGRCYAWTRSGRLMPARCP
jgi:hypothetical protein